MTTPERLKTVVRRATMVSEEHVVLFAPRPLSCSTRAAISSRCSFRLRELRYVYDPLFAWQFTYLRFGLHETTSNAFEEEQAAFCNTIDFLVAVRNVVSKKNSNHMSGPGISQAVGRGESP